MSWSAKPGAAPHRSGCGPIVDRGGQQKIINVVVEGVSQGFSGRNELAGVIQRNNGRADTINPVMRQLLAQTGSRAAALFGLAGAIGSLHGPQTITEIVSYLGLLNMMLAIFNLIPPFPLDGGRMLRAALWGWRHDVRRATRIAAGAGEAFGILLIVLGVFAVLHGDFVGGLWQFPIGMFVRMAARAGYQQTMAQRLLASASVAQVMTSNAVSDRLHAR